MSIQSDLAAFGVTQVLVTLKPDAAGGSALEGADPSAGLAKHFRASADSQPGALEMAAASGGPRRPAPSHRVYRNLGVILGTVDPKGYAALKKEKNVKAVTAAPVLSLIRPVGGGAAKLAPGPTWGITRMNVPAVWKQGLTGKGVVVAHLDTGVDDTHPALVKAVAQFAQFDDMGNQVTGAKATDSGTHGTHTAGTIAGRPVGKAQFGVAFGASLACAMVIESGNVVARILGGMDWAIGQGARILNMSLGLRGYNDQFLGLMQIVRSRGVLPVIAVGNEGPGTSRSPGNYDSCLSVGATTEQDEVWGDSSSQIFKRDQNSLVPDVVAPGAGVFSALPGKAYGLNNGTSMATPHIAGLAALLFEANPTATVDDVENAIVESCNRPKSMPEARANHGVPDAVVALRLLPGGTAPVSMPKPEPKKKPKPKPKKKPK